MPGPFTHIYAARRVADLLSQQGGFVAAGDGPVAPGQPLANPAQAAYYAQVMHEYPNLASLGAIGPDMFFFLGDLHGVPGDEFMLLLRMGYLLDTWTSENWAPLIKLLTSNGYEQAHPWSGILALILQIDAAWQDFAAAYTEAVAPIVDGVVNVADALTGDLLNTLGQALQEFVSIAEGLIATLGLDTTDVLGYFKLIMESGEDETAFYWSDMLHYRRTSQMAQALIRRAEQMIPQNQAQGEQFLAYALGFACHLGVDVVGHAFVNEQAGGPYRTHWQRHHLVENHLDAWVYSQTAGPALAWDQAGNTEGKDGSPWNFGNIAGNPFFTGDFTGSGKTEILFYAPGPTTSGGSGPSPGPPSPGPPPATPAASARSPTTRSTPATSPAPARPRSCSTPPRRPTGTGGSAPSPGPASPGPWPGTPRARAAARGTSATSPPTRSSPATSPAPARPRSCSTPRRRPTAAGGWGPSPAAR
jgi:hypothetical protein